MSARRFNKIAVATTPVGPVYPGFRGSYRITVGNETAGDSISNCDFLDAGDGSELKQAINEASGLGAEVYVRPGTYTLSWSSVQITGAVVTGAGHGTILVPYNANAAVFLMQSNSVLRNLTIDTQSSSTSPGEVSLVTVHHSASSVLIENVVFRACVGDGTAGDIASAITVDGGDVTRNINVSQCSFFVDVLSTINFTDPSSAVLCKASDPRSTLSVRNCYFAPNDNEEAQSAIWLRGGTNIIIDNFFERPKEHCIVADGQFGDMHGSRISGNVICNIESEDAIFLRVNADSESGYMHDISISNNTIGRYNDGASTGIGIRLETNSDGINMENISIIGNVVWAEVGISINQAGTDSIIATLVDANQLRGCATPLADSGTSTVIGTNSI